MRLALFCCVWAFSSCSEGQLLSVVAHGLSCPMTCGILVLRPGIKPKSPALAGGCLASGPPGKSSIPYFKVYFVWYEYCYLSFLLISICMEYLFWTPHFQSVYVPRSEVGLLQIAYIWVLFLIHVASLCLLVWVFNSFTCKVIIDTYVLIAILLIVLDLFCRSFFFPFLFCSPVIWWL